MLTSIRIVNTVDILLLTVLGIFTCLMIAYGPLFQIIFNGVVFFLLLVKFYCMRRYFNPLLFGYITITIIYLGLILSFVSIIGFYDAGFTWILIIPLLAALLTNYRGCLIFLALSLLLAIVSLYLTEMKYIPLYSLSPESLHLFNFTHQFLSLVVVGLVLCCFLYERNRLDMQLLKINETLGISEKKYRKQANFDQLTKVYNRRPFMAHLEKIFRKSSGRRKFLLAYIDMDDFKAVNDNYGHPVGDELLQLTVKRLQNIIKNADAIGRLGGDEFVILATNIEEKVTAEKFAQRLVDAFQKPFIIDNNQISSTVSVGIACYPDDGESAFTLLSLADEALYRVKLAGRNNYQFYNKQCLNGPNGASQD